MKIYKFFFSVFLIIPSLVYAADLAKVAGIYSSLEFHNDTGDIIGDEIIVGLSNEGYFVIFQTSEGEPRMPIVVRALVDNDQIFFDLPVSEYPGGKFIGKISPLNLSGKFQNTGHYILLQRKSSYWQ